MDTGAMTGGFLVLYWCQSRQWLQISPSSRWPKGRSAN